MTTHPWSEIKHKKREPQTWEEAAQRVAEGVLGEYGDRLQRASLGSTAEALDRRFDELRSAVENQDSAWTRIEYRHLASIALVGYVAASNRRVRSVMDTVLETIASKQHDYGYDNIAGFGSTGLVVRISDKLARLHNLKKRGVPANEPLLDTWLDIVGYCIVGLMWENGTFSLPLAADVERIAGVDEIPQDDMPPTDAPPSRAFNRADLSEIREIVVDTVACNEWVRKCIEYVAREEIEKWHTEARATNTPKQPSEQVGPDPMKDLTPSPLPHEMNRLSLP